MGLWLSVTFFTFKIYELYNFDKNSFQKFSYRKLSFCIHKKSMIWTFLDPNSGIVHISHPISMNYIFDSKIHDLNNFWTGIHVQDNFIAILISERFLRPYVSYPNFRIILDLYLWLGHFYRNSKFKILHYKFTIWLFLDLYSWFGQFCTNTHILYILLKKSMIWTNLDPTSCLDKFHQNP